MATKLRAVSADDKPPTARSIVEAAASGTTREQLVALRSLIARAVEDPNCPPRDLAALSRRLMEITKEIDAIDQRDREDIDELPTPDDEWEAV